MGLRILVAQFSAAKHPNAIETENAIKLARAIPEISN
jgi:hypothetical protein